MIPYGAAIRFCEVASKIGASDEAIARGLGISLYEMAVLAHDREDFFNAITPNDEMRARWAAEDAIERERRRLRSQRYYAKARLKPSFRIKVAMLSRIRQAARGKASPGWSKNLDYTVQQLREHLEDRFKPGMSWDNYGRWHIDHIKPCAAFDLSDHEQFRACWALSNLQPLWAIENMRKGAKVLL